VKLLEGTTSKGTDAADASGQWTIALSGVPEGSHSYTAKATDAAGNASARSEVRMLIVGHGCTPGKQGRTSRERHARSPRGERQRLLLEAMTAGSVDTTTVKLFKASEDSARKAIVTYDGAANRATLVPNADLRRGDRYR
jgi:hypothetical protein